MSRREFDPATNSEADGEIEEVAHHSATSESGDDDKLENEEEMTSGKKKRAKLVLKDFVKVERRDWMEMSDTAHLCLS